MIGCKFNIGAGLLPDFSADSGHFYNANRNKRTTPEKIAVKKYDPKARKHFMH